MAECPLCRTEYEPPGVVFDYATGWIQTAKGKAQLTYRECQVAAYILRYPPATMRNISAAVYEHGAVDPLCPEENVSQFLHHIRAKVADIGAELRNVGIGVGAGNQGIYQIELDGKVQRWTPPTSCAT